MTQDAKQLTTILRDAWDVFRLDTIRETVEQAICELNALDLGVTSRRYRPQHALSPEDAAATRSAVQAALDVCCDELREGCGVPVTGVRSVPRPDSAWEALYHGALAHYRNSAADVLRTAFGALPRPPRGRQPPRPSQPGPR